MITYEIDLWPIYICETILSLLTRFFLFKKMGLARWKALIPIYSDYLVFKCAWGGDKYVLQFVMTALSALLLGRGAVMLLQNASLLQVIIYFVVTGILLIMNTIISLVCKYKLSRCFGHGLPYAIGLIFLQPIFYLILALSKDQYTSYKELY